VDWKSRIQRQPHYGSKHLFFYCYYAKILWGLSNLAFNISPPRTISHLYGTWLNQFGGGGRLKRQALARASTFCWTIWPSRNDMIFDKFYIKTFMHVLFRGTHWLRFWTQMEWHDQDKVAIMEACRLMEIIVIEFFADHRWRFSNMLCG
jgi:hypothetical protein